MTIDEVNKIDEQAYNEMKKQKSEAQTKFNAYFEGYEKGIDVIYDLLIAYLSNKKDSKQE